MATNRMAYDALQTTMARHRVTVYDLYGLLGVSPNANDGQIREAYEAIVKAAHPSVPDNVFSVAHSVLVNPAKRAQYDRDRLEYLYTHFGAHAEFPAAALARAETSRDEQIQVYATTLAERVRDPLEDKKAAVQARAARTRANLDEYHERSDALRQDWATSPNEILRMAGNALREIVVCAEEDLLMLEDELGRLEGILAPADRDGPAGRVTSGQYASDAGAAPLQGRHPLLAAQRVPSLPRSPTVPVAPKSASRLGVAGEDGSGRGESSEDDPSPAVATFPLGDRVRAFLLGPAGAVRVRPVDTTAADTNVANATTAAVLHDALGRSKGLGTRGYIGNKTFSSLFQAPPTPMEGHPLQQDDKAKHGSPSPSAQPDVSLPPAAGSGMGLVEWQRVNGPRAFSSSDDSPSFWDSLNVKPVQVVEPSPDSSASSARAHPFAGAGAFVPPQDAERVEPVFRRPNRQLAARHVHPTSLHPHPEEPFHHPLPAAGGVLPSQNYGFHIAQPLGRLHPGADAVAARGGSNVPAPGVGRVPTAKQSVAIKDFQVRVWKSATGTAAAAGADKKEREKNKDKEKENAAPGVGGAGPAPAAPATAPPAASAQTKEEIEKTREEFKRQITQLAALNATRAGGQKAAQQGGEKNRAGDGAGAATAAAAGTSGEATGGEKAEEEVFRRSKAGAVVARRPGSRIEDPFV